MSLPQTDTAETLAKIRNDESVRQDVEALADRDDKMGALARVILAVADGRRPDSSDCSKAEIQSIERLYESAQ